jgi:hypothetical protein
MTTLVTAIELTFVVLCAHYLFVLLFSKYQLSHKLNRLAYHYKGFRCLWRNIS